MTAIEKLQGVVPDLPEAEYHAHPAFSSTQARAMLKSARTYKHSLTSPMKASQTLDYGSAAHSLVLGTGWPIVIYPDEHLTKSGAVSTKAETREWEDQQRAAGNVLVTSDDMRAIEDIAGEIDGHAEAHDLVHQAGLREASVFATCPETGVEMRARFDLLADTAVDLKTTTDASPDMWPNTVQRWRYHVQIGHYRQAYEHATGKQIGAFKIVAVEKTAPYLVAVHELDDYYDLIGRDLALDARRRLVVCREHDIWPGYPGNNITTPPAWVAVDYEGRMGGSDIEV